MRPNDIRVIVTLALLLAPRQLCQGQTKPAFADQFIHSEKNKIEVETRNHTIQIKASGLGTFSRCRPYLAWRAPGATQWTEDVASDLQSERISSRETKLTCSVGPVIASVFMKRLDANVFEFSGSIKNQGAKTIEMARFHYLHGVVDPHGDSFIACDSFGMNNFGVTKSADDVAPAGEKLANWCKSAGVSMPTLSDPFHDAKNWASSLDVGIFAPALNKPGWFMGYTGPGTAYGEIGFKTQTQPPQFYSGVLLDNVILESGSSRTLEKFIVYAGDWQDAMGYWVNLTAKEFNVKPQAKPLVGFCSWYQWYGGVTPEHVLRANDEFAVLPVPPGGRAIQIDDGFQVMPGNWGPNPRFEKEWKELPNKISAKGSMPGLWLAPTAIGDIHPISKSHPEMLQRLPNGDCAVSFSNWKWCADSNGNHVDKTYFLEFDRPDSKAFIADIMKNAVKDGWRYFKLDFTYGLSTARIAYDRKKTMFESLRDLYAGIRKATGPGILLNGCIGYTERYPLGNIDIIRMGGDIGGNWAQVQGNLRELLTRSYANGVWYQGDPDVFFMRKANSSLNEEENFLLTGSIGLIGGVFLTSDYPSQWSQEARKAVDAFWTPEGPRVPARHFVDYGDDNAIKAYMVSYNDAKAGPQHRVGLYNWSDGSQTIRIAMNELKLKSDLKWKAAPFLPQQSVSLQDSSIVVQNMPAHSLRIVDLRVE